jgi:FHA domain
MMPDGYDDKKTLVLRGTGGLLDGESHLVRLGEEVTVGRSRHCDFSLKKTKAYLLADDRESIREDPGFLRISRKHIRVAFVNEGMVEVEILGQNGVQVDGKRVDRVVLTDLETRSHAVNMGGGHTFEIRRGAA